MALGVVILVLLIAPWPAAAAVRQQGCDPSPCPSSSLVSIPTSQTTTTEASTSTSATKALTTPAAPSRSTTATSATGAYSPSTSATSTTGFQPTKGKNLLVPGDGTAGADRTTTTQAGRTRLSGSGPNDSALIAAMVGGLLVLALVVGLLTRRYWDATRPSPPTRGTHARPAR